MQLITVEIGRDRTHRIALTAAGVPVPADTLTRVVARVGPHCLDTDNGLEWDDSKQAVDAQFGLIAGLTPGAYDCYITGEDNAHPNGLPYKKFKIKAIAWPTCPVTEE